MTLPLLCRLILIRRHVTNDCRLFTYNVCYYGQFRSPSVTEELPLQHLREGETAVLGWTQLDYSKHPPPPTAWFRQAR
jgi:hypothetical protein